MTRRYWIFTLLIAITVSSCNLPGTPAQAAPLSTPTTAPATTVLPTLTAVPIETLFAEVVLPTQEPTSTPVVTLASPRDQPVNCRFGPDISYAVIGALLPGRRAEVVGKNIDITWLFVRNPSDPSTSCWLSVDFINVDGDVERLPVVGPPEIRVTNIEVSIDPPSMNVACDALPQSVLISAEISTNGPSIVTWQWSSNIGQTSDVKQVLFESGGTKTVQDYYVVPNVADYAIQVSTILPNPATGSANFKVVCTP